MGACVSIPSGPLADKFQHNSRVCKLVTAAGFAGIGLGFALLGPFSWESIGAAPAGSRGGTGAPPPAALLGLAESMAAAYAGMIIKSVGNVYSQLMIYPDLMMNLPTDPFIQARVSALWNASYGLGWALGPLFGAAFVTLFEGTSDSYQRCSGRSAPLAVVGSW